ncbi:luciferin sulfotransferase-like [Schistocerca serialis cubense]|uniref:luciferin sulfotransferase-like n=1 Tax=Schistocerca serialis cubense TaxID=2023355 RepID=UPI00214F2591|nr:luciferin sulfotransferase-like [Schistocerca serialis cubense]
MSVSAEPLDTPRMREFLSKITGPYNQDFVKLSPSSCVMPTLYMDIAQRVIDFEVRPDDVWIVTYPKCGTTWSQEMIWLVMNNFDYDTAYKIPLHERTPFIEFSSILKPVADLGPHSIEACAKLKSPRFIKSHLPLQLLPKQLWTAKPKIIYVVRNVKDTIVSYYHHYNLWSDVSMSLDEFAQFFTEDLPMYNPFWTHVLDFWNIRNEPNVLFYSYEDMKADLASVIRRVGEFLGKPVPEEQMPKMLDHLSVEKMRANPHANHQHVAEYVRKQSGLPSATAAGKHFIRSGKVGGALNELSAAMRQKIDSWTEECLRGSDYSGPR